MLRRTLLLSPLLAALPAQAADKPLVVMTSYTG